MTKLVLVRQGQASFGEEDYDKLSTLGHQQSEWLGFFLRAKGYRFDRIVQGVVAVRITVRPAIDGYRLDVARRIVPRPARSCRP